MALYLLKMLEVHLGAIVSSYFMPGWGIVKTMSRGAVGSSMNYCPRPLGRGLLRIELSTTPRDIVFDYSAKQP